MNVILIKPTIKKYKCLLCLRHNFDRATPHRCVGGYRKRKLVWKKYFAPSNVVLLEKKSEKNKYQNIINNVFKLYSNS